MAETTTLGLGRYFTRSGKKAYDQLTWVKRDSEIINPMTGEAVFEQKGVEFPEDWSLNAINIVAQKYFAGTPGEADREDGLKVLIDRIVDTITRAGVQEDYFIDDKEAESFREELKFILLRSRPAS